MGLCVLLFLLLVYQVPFVVFFTFFAHFEQVTSSEDCLSSLNLLLCAMMESYFLSVISSTMYCTCMICVPHLHWLFHGLFSTNSSMILCCMSKIPKVNSGCTHQHLVSISTTPGIIHYPCCRP
ncbi:hypothetical protein COCSADRAFT_274165 [Bipolaris sorokiniana ND90Pr]|uniref:Uncharacterized protein n=1 Tax=Cochliobolus sativus (strain ND90Pr / ATCC 201652) TaxID=665912 RepID=M2TH91_COCSN|nr:uncharacterized protein COCSADRAFT_274165 [Bipolaris sorokiniana ND90Pr]EMD68586.1 hypothetical protein COCSADRAFT_274165 [Bipolaris sorokiniana ND90Pr]